MTRRKNEKVLSFRLPPGQAQFGQNGLMHLPLETYTQCSCLLACPGQMSLLLLLLLYITWIKHPFKAHLACTRYQSFTLQVTHMSEEVVFFEERALFMFLFLNCSTLHSHLLFTMLHFSIHTLVPTSLLQIWDSNVGGRAREEHLCYRYQVGSCLEGKEAPPVF